MSATCSTWRCKLEDLTRNAGKHAGGVVIAPTAADRLLSAVRGTCRPGRDGQEHPVTQFDKDDVEAIGLVKFDFLGLRTLTIIDWAVKADQCAPRERRSSRRWTSTRLAAGRQADLPAVRARRPPWRCSSSNRAACSDCSSDAEARLLRGPDRAGRAVPPRPAGRGHGRRLHRPQARPRPGRPTRIRALEADPASRPTASSSTRNR